MICYDLILSLAGPSATDMVGSTDVVHHISKFKGHVVLYAFMGGCPINYQIVTI